jgi:hypothetical protein
MAEKHPKRPRDLNQAAKLVVDIASGQVHNRTPTPEEQGKNPAAAALGSKGGRSRALKLSSDQRRKVAQEAARVRWAARRSSDD